MMFQNIVRKVKSVMPDRFDFKSKTTHPNVQTLNEPTTSDSDDSHLNKIFQYETYNTEIPKSF